MLYYKEDNCVVIKYKQKPRIYISSSSHVQTSRLLAKRPKCGHLLGAPPHYSKLKKEEVIYKVRFVHKYRVLPLHTAYASRASARDHVTWNARTVTNMCYDSGCFGWSRVHLH